MTSDDYTIIISSIFLDGKVLSLSDLTASF